MPDVNTKYLGAWEEISSRLRARETILLLFIALTTLGVGLSLASQNLANCCLPLGYVALATAFLSRHHDLIIANLRSFQKEISARDGGGIDMPEYTSPGYLGRAIRERSKREYAQILFIMFGACSSLYNADREIASPFSMIAVLWYGSILCSALAIMVAIKTQQDRKLFTARQ